MANGATLDICSVKLCALSRTTCGCRWQETTRAHSPARYSIEPCFLCLLNQPDIQFVGETLLMLMTLQENIIHIPHSATRNPHSKKKKKKKKKKNEKNGQKTRQCRAQSKHDILTKDLNNVAKNFENEWY
jgi:hypothetical protein